MPKKKELSFEENLAQLEQIVAKLEGGNATLEEIMADYTRSGAVSKLLQGIEEGRKAD